MSIATLVPAIYQTAETVEIQLTNQAREQAVKKAGFVKVTLWYETRQPMMTSFRELMKPPYKIETPLLEFLTILKPAAKTYDLVWAFLEDFERLKDEGWTPKDARLVDFDIIEEDQRFLALVVAE